MKSKLKHIEINIPVFKSHLHYVFNCDCKELTKYCHRKFDTDEDFELLKDSNGAMLTLRSKDAVKRIVWLKKFDLSHENLGVLVHETTHAVIRILEWKGIPYSAENNQDETFAYLMDYLISNFIYRYKKMK